MHNITASPQMCRKNPSNVMGQAQPEGSYSSPLVSLPASSFPLQEFLGFQNSMSASQIPSNHVSHPGHTFGAVLPGRNSVHCGSHMFTQVPLIPCSLSSQQLVYQGLNVYPPVFVAQPSTSVMQPFLQYYVPIHGSVVHENFVPNVHRYPNAIHVETTGVDNTSLLLSNKNTFNLNSAENKVHCVTTSLKTQATGVHSVNSFSKPVTPDVTSFSKIIPKKCVPMAKLQVKIRRYNNRYNGDTTKHGYRSKQNKIDCVFQRLQRRYDRNDILCPKTEVLRGTDVLRIHVKKYNALDKIETVCNVLDDRTDLEILKVSIPLSMKNQYQKKGFLLYLKFATEAQVNIALETFKQYTEFKKGVQIAVPRDTTPQKKFSVSNTSYSVMESEDDSIKTLHTPTNIAISNTTTVLEHMEQQSGLPPSAAHEASLQSMFGNEKDNYVDPFEDAKHDEMFLAPGAWRKRSSLEAAG